MFQINCLNPISKVGLDRLTADYKVTDNMNDAEGVLVRSASMHEMDLPENLLAVARAGAGVNNIPLDKCAQKGIVVFNTPGANANGVKELVIAGMLLAARDVVGGIEWVKASKDNADIAKAAEKEKKKFAGTEVMGKKLGVIGLGAIGVKVANTAVSLGMEVYGYDPYVSVNAAWNLSRSVKHVMNVEEIYADCDYITIHVPLLDSTKGMINKEAISKIFAENDIDRVVHFAAESHVDRSIRNPEIFVQTNVLGTAVMLNCAKAAWELPDGSFKAGKKFLHVSTDEVYGSLPDDDNAFFYETTPYDPHSPYSASKASSDMLVKAYMDTYHFPANITNCSNNYGPFQFPEKLIPLIINNALHGKKLPVYGDGKNVRDWLYVEDHAKAIDMVQEQGSLFQTYNIGGHNEKQNIEIIHIIIETLQEMLPDSDPRKAHINNDLITYVEDRKGHDRRYAIAPDKIKAEIGWYPETMFKEGIRKTIAWYFEHEDWMNNVTSGDYQKYYNEMYEEK